MNPKIKLLNSNRCSNEITTHSDVVNTFKVSSSNLLLTLQYKCLIVVTNKRLDIGKCRYKIMLKLNLISNLLYDRIWWTFYSQ